MGSLTGKTALVTGAGRRRGIGLGIARQLAAAGCNVVINDIETVQDQGLQAVAELQESGIRAEFVSCDVSDRSQVDVMIDHVEATYGQIDFVCSNAGVADWQNVEELTADSFDRIVAVNLTGTFNVCQSAARRMVTRRQGRIIVTSSVHVQMPFPSMSVYGSTKQAIRSLVDHMAIELSPRGILVNHIGPGWVKSFLNDGSPSLQTAEDEEVTLSLIPLNRPAEPEEMGDAVVFLCSEQSAYVTGSFLRIDGGFVVGKF
jgi:NAD(P)-dependent dehydrogenase (short-subunit alcohol dehydrogenase family)